MWQHGSRSLAEMISMSPHGSSGGVLLTRFLQEKNKTDSQHLAPGGIDKPGTPIHVSVNPKLIFVTTGLPGSPH